MSIKITKTLESEGGKTLLLLQVTFAFDDGNLKITALSDIIINVLKLYT